MQGQITLTLSEETMKVFLKKLDDIQAAILKQSSGGTSESEEWLTASEYCMKYRIGRTTLQRQVYDGRVAVQDLGGRIKRYRPGKVCQA